MFVFKFDGIPIESFHSMVFQSMITVKGKIRRHLIYVGVQALDSNPALDASLTDFASLSSVFEVE